MRSIISTDVEVLQDKRKSGKDRPWKQYKSNNLEVAGSYKRIGYEKKHERMKQCAGYLEFAECPNGCEKKLVSAIFCQVRLCPMCSARRSVLVFQNLREVVHQAQQQEKLEFLFLTLTAKTVSSDQVCDEITKYFKAWQNLSKRRPFKRSIVGWFRVLEITHNWKKDTYHPHFHCILAVRKSYFGGNYYIKQADWAQMWKECMQLDYTPVIDIRRVKPKREGQTNEAAIAEVSKYAVKPSDIIHKNKAAQDKAVETLDKALHNRRLVAYGGILKEIRSELKQADEEKADLVKLDDEETGCNCTMCNTMYEEARYHWHVGYRDYVKQEVQ